MLYEDVVEGAYLCEYSHTRVVDGRRGVECMDVRVRAAGGVEAVNQSRARRRASIDSNRRREIETGERAR